MSFASDARRELAAEAPGEPCWPAEDPAPAEEPSLLPGFCVSALAADPDEPACPCPVEAPPTSCGAFVDPSVTQAEG